MFSAKGAAQASAWGSKAFNRLNRGKKKARPEHDLAFGRIRPN
jgi:hypothetical protein